MGISNLIVGSRLDKVQYYITNEEKDKLDKSSTIVLENNTTIKEEIVKMILAKDDFCEYIDKLITEEKKVCELTIKIDGISKIYDNYNISDILKALDVYIGSESVLYTEEAIIKYKNLINKVLIKSDKETIKVSSINRITTTNDRNVDIICINEDLINKILEGSEDLTMSKKIIYIYLNMCYLLMYDEEFYAAGQRGPSKDKHENIENVFDITLENNKVVCYEFAVILGYILKKLNVNYLIDNPINTGFGGGHADLVYSHDNYIVLCDAVFSIIENDMFNVKLGKTVLGLSCENDNPYTKEKFNKLVGEVYNIFKSKKGYSSTFESDIKEYQGNYQILNLSLENRISLFFNKMNTTSFSDIEYYCYAKHLSKIYFTEKELKEDIDLTFIRKNNIQYDRDNCKIFSIFTIKQRSGIYLYYYLNKDKIEEVNKGDLFKLFREGYLEYIDFKKSNIPGLFDEEKNHVR